MGISEAWEEIGARESSPEINSQIRRQLGLERTIEAEVLKSAARAVLSWMPYERGSVGEVKERLSRLRDVGYPVKSYSKMKASEVKKYFSRLKSEIVISAKRTSPGVLREIREEKERRIQETNY